MKTSVTIAVLFLTALALTSSRAGSQDTGAIHGSVRLHGWVPAVCRADVPDLHPEPDEAGSVRFVGTLEELCNGAGYRVWLEHTGSVRGVAIIDNVQIALDPSGRTLISRSAQPEQRRRALVLRFDGNAAPQSVAVHLQPGI